MFHRRPLDMVTSGEEFDALCPAEQALVECVKRGELFDLAGDQGVDESRMRLWDPSRTIRARVVRDIVRGRLVADPDPHGLRLRGARIAGRVDLENITSTVWVELYDCLLDEGLNARDTHLPGLVLSGCYLGQPTLDAPLTTAAVDGTMFTVHSNHGAMHVAGAHFGVLDCTGTRLRNDSGPALIGDRLRVDQGVFMRGGFEAIGTGAFGAVHLSGAHFGRLECTGARLRNDSGPALMAEDLQIDQSLFLRGGFEATGTGDKGAVNLSGGHVGRLDCTDGRLRNDSGPALTADRLRVDQTVFLRGGFEATGAGELGAVRLVGAHAGHLECDGARLRNGSGPALDADGLRVDQDVFLRGGFEATGAGELGAVRLVGAHFGVLDCSSARLRNDSGPALNAQVLRVDQSVFLRGRFEAIGGGEGVALNLIDVQIGGILVFDPARLEHSTSPQQRLDIDGLTYNGLPLGVTARSWLRLLSEGTPGYAAQPYQQLAAGHRTAGHDSEARRVLIQQRRDQIHRKALTGRAERAWARLTGLTLGYGYRPWRALIGLLGVVITSVLLAVVLGAHGGLTDAKNPLPPDATGCAVMQRIGIGLDVGTPLITTSARDHCAATDNTTGQILTISGWVLRLLAWAFATLFIAGFTGAVRKT